MTALPELFRCTALACTLTRHGCGDRHLRAKNKVRESGLTRWDWPSFLRDHADRDALASVTAASATLAALPADLAAQREVRIRADERVKTLRKAVDAIEADDEVPPTETLERMEREAKVSR